LYRRASPFATEQQSKLLRRLLRVLPLMHDMLSAFFAEFLELFHDPVVFSFIVISNVIGLVAFRAKPRTVLTFPFRHILKSYLNRFAGSILSKSEQKSKKKPRKQPFKQIRKLPLSPFTHIILQIRY